VVVVVVVVEGGGGLVGGVGGGGDIDDVDDELMRELSIEQIVSLGSRVSEHSKNTTFSCTLPRILLGDNHQTLDGAWLAL
jgi:hypothetical protein